MSEARSIGASIVLQRVERPDRPVDGERETDRVESTGTEEQERVDLERDRLRTGVVAPQRLGRVRESTIALARRTRVPARVQRRDQRTDQVEVLHRGDEAEAMRHSRPLHGGRERLGVAAGVAHLDEVGRSGERNVRDRGVAEDDRDIGPRRLVAGGQVARAETGAGGQRRPVAPDLLAQSRRELVGVPHEPGGHLEDDPPRSRGRSARTARDPRWERRTMVGPTRATRPPAR